MNLEEIDLILISGGDGIEKVIDEEMVENALKRAYRLEVPIASICASAVLLAKAGIIAEKKFTCMEGTFKYYQNIFSQSTYTGADVEVGAGYITAKGTSYPEFTIETCKLLGLVKDGKHAERMYLFCTGKR